MIETEIQMQFIYFQFMFSSLFLSFFFINDTRYTFNKEFAWKFEMAMNIYMTIRLLDFYFAKGYLFFSTSVKEIISAKVLYIGKLTVETALTLNI